MVKKKDYQISDEDIDKAYRDIKILELTNKMLGFKNDTTEMEKKILSKIDEIIK